MSQESCQIFGLQRVIKDCNDKRRFRKNGKGRKQRTYHIYTSGFACQPWSIAGNNHGLADSRSSTLTGCLRCIKTEEPQIFVLENVKNFAGPKHLHVKNKLMKQLKSHKYIVHEAILNSLDCGSCQSRERWYCVGYKKKLAKAARFNFKWPSKQPGLRLSTVFSLKFDDVAVASYNYTIRRNWSEVEKVLNSDPRWKEQPGPFIVDLFQSPSRGVLLRANCCPTITRVHAENQAYWLVVVQTNSDKRRKYVKRPLGTQDLLVIQGWPFESFARFKSLPARNMRAALGNAMNLAVMKKVWKSLKELLVYMDKKDM